MQFGMIGWYSPAIRVSGGLRRESQSAAAFSCARIAEVGHGAAFPLPLYGHPTLSAIGSSANTGPRGNEARHRRTVASAAKSRTPGSSVVRAAPVRASPCRTTRTNYAKSGEKRDIGEGCVRFRTVGGPGSRGGWPHCCARACGGAHGQLSERARALLVHGPQRGLQDRLATPSLSAGGPGCQRRG